VDFATNVSTSGSFYRRAPVRGVVISHGGVEERTTRRKASSTGEEEARWEATGKGEVKDGNRLIPGYMWMILS